MPAVDESVALMILFTCYWSVADDVLMTLFPVVFSRPASFPYATA